MGVLVGEGQNKNKGPVGYSSILPQVCQTNFYLNVHHLVI